MFFSPYETGYTYSSTSAYQRGGSNDYRHPQLCRRVRYEPDGTLHVRSFQDEQDIRARLAEYDYDQYSGFVSSILTRIINFFKSIIVSIFYSILYKGIIFEIISTNYF